MKKSDVTVSMPMTTFEEFESYKKKYIELKKNLNECVEKLEKGSCDYKLKLGNVLAIIKKETFVKDNDTIETTWN